MLVVYVSFRICGEEGKGDFILHPERIVSATKVRLMERTVGMCLRRNEANMCGNDSQTFFLWFVVKFLRCTDIVYT